MVAETRGVNKGVNINPIDQCFLHPAGYRNVDFKDTRYFNIHVKIEFWIIKERYHFWDFWGAQRFEEK